MPPAAGGCGVGFFDGSEIAVPAPGVAIGVSEGVPPPPFTNSAACRAASATAACRAASAAAIAAAACAASVGSIGCGTGLAQARGIVVVDDKRS